MPDPERISPLLDGFSMGSPMSSHDGIQCCPAIKENTDQKYIVKIISVPASQVQLDALLLAGAYKDPADAMDYFREMGEDIMKEAELLKGLSKLEGFLSYDAWQMEPITKKRLGYNVYLVGSYKRSLEKYLRRNPVTHLEAVNLGLDLCAALSMCRQAGALYVDLKPANIFVSEKKEYSIGDLGFISLDALRYSTIPDRCRSAYTPPELYDPMNPLNLTVDTYAVGMILYQLYNDGQLPFQGKAPEEALPSPVNADYELAEIIMKAIHPDPAQRWEDPKDMGQALRSYMQRNTVNDVPVTPYTPLEVPPEEPEAGQDAPEVSSDAPQEPVPPSEDGASDTEEPPDAPEPLTEPVEEASPGEDTPPESPPPEDLQEPQEELPETEPDLSDDTAPGDADADDLMPHEMSDELSRIMAKADDLIAHETPEGVVLPDIPDPPDPFAFVQEDSDDLDDTGIPLDPVMEDETEEGDKKRKKGKKSFASQEGKRRRKKIASILILLLVLAALGFGAYWFYQNLYLQTIRGIDIDGTKHELTVTIDSDVADGLLTVTCSDNFGNVQTQTVSGGQAVFTGLVPDTLYTVRLEISGFHSLVGQTSDIFTTDTTTSIISFSPVAGAEDGTVILNFTVDGEEPEEWTVSYSAEGEEEQVQSFTGHSVTVSGLSVGKIYTFVLDAGDSLSLSGQTSLEYMAARLILAENLTITSTGGSDMTVHWTAPGDVVVNSWDVRCYSESGYDQQFTVDETEVYFTDIDPTVSYTVEVTAEGMTQPARTSITANPINITQFTMANDQDPELENLEISWEYTGAAPESGWLLMYSIDGSNIPTVVKCDSAAAEISPKIPGAKYQFTLQAADGTSIFSNVYTYTCPDAEPLDENGLSADHISGQLLKTPENANWRYDNVSSDAYTDQFALGDGISLVLHGDTDFYLPGYDLDILYVIRDSHGNVLPELVSQEHTYWKDFWYAGDYHYGELTLPEVPDTAGSYVLNLYFNGAAVVELNFTITE